MGFLEDIKFFLRQQDSSRVTSCGIKRVGTLAKAFSRGACATLKPTDELEYVLLCFSHSAGKLCTKFLGFNGNRTGVIQETGPQSNSDHLTTSLGLFDGHAIVVGSAPDRERGIGGNKKSRDNEREQLAAI